MEALYLLTGEVLDVLHANVAVIDGDGVVLAVNKRWRHFGRRNGATSDFVGHNYLDVCAQGASLGDRDAMRVQRRLRRLLDGELESFTLAYHCTPRVFRLRATRVSSAPVRVLFAHEDITGHLKARRKAWKANAGLADMRNQHAVRIGQAYEELGQRLAAIGLATHVIERAGHGSSAVDTIRTAVGEARDELRVLRYWTEDAPDENPR